MNKILSPVSPDNPLVYFDICIGEEKAGRMIMELRKDVVPKSAENFRALCTGECGIGKLGKPLHYKGIRFHKVTRVFAAQGGDIINNNGTSGESIYGPVFDDENFELKHEEGVISMANYSVPNSNNSQFSITSVPCQNLDGRNVVIGQVLRGLGVVGEMEQNTSDDGQPTEEIYIANCGELAPDEEWGFCERDETEDRLPPFPQDWDQKFILSDVQGMLQVLFCIRNSGNYYFLKQKYYDARRKYRKAYRYYNFFYRFFEWKSHSDVKESRKLLDSFMAVNNVNMAAVELKLKMYASAKYYCTEAIRVDENNSKAYYRRGIAQIALKDYEEAIQDLKKAHDLNPENKQILNEMHRAKKLLHDYNQTQKTALKTLFK